MNIKITIGLDKPTLTFLDHLVVRQGDRIMESLDQINSKVDRIIAGVAAMKAEVLEDVGELQAKVQELLGVIAGGDGAAEKLASLEAGLTETGTRLDAISAEVEAFDPVADEPVP